MTEAEVKLRVDEAVRQLCAHIERLEVGFLGLATKPRRSVQIEMLDRTAQELATVAYDLYVIAANVRKG